MSQFPLKNGSTAPATAPSTETPTVNTDLPAGYDDEGSDFFVPVEARPGYHTDPAEEMLAFGEEMSRPRVMGWMPGPLAIAQQRVFDQAYTEARERALAAGEAEQRWPAPEQLSPGQRRRRSGVDPLGAGAPRTADAESVEIWQHRRRIERALREVAAVRDQIARRAAYDRSHTCTVCQSVSADVTSREVLHVKLQACGPCEPILNAGLIAVLAREQVGEHRTRGEAVAQWLRIHGQRWAGLQFPAEKGQRTVGDGVQGRGLPQPPPAMQSGPPLP